MSPKRLRPAALGAHLAPSLLVLAALSSQAQAACPTPVSLSGLTRGMDTAEQAYSNLDLDGFMAATNELRGDLPCLGQALEPDIAARYHRLEGLRGYVDQDRRASTQSFAAARSIDATYRFPETLVPAGYPEWEFYEAMDITLGTEEKIPPRIEGWLRVDGKETQTRPTDWATIIQSFDDDGKVLGTWYLRPGMAVPSEIGGGKPTTAVAKDTTDPTEFLDDDEDVFEDEPSTPRAPASRAGVDDDEDIPPPRSTPSTASTPSSSSSSSSASSSSSTGKTSGSRSGGWAGDGGSSTPRTTGGQKTNPSQYPELARAQASLDKTDKGKPVGLLVTATTSAIGAGVSYGLALRAANEYRDLTTPYEDLNSLRIQANVLSGVAGGLGLLAFGTGIAVGVSW